MSLFKIFNVKQFFVKRKDLSEINDSLHYHQQLEQQQEQQQHQKPTSQFYNNDLKPTLLYMPNEDLQMSKYLFQDSSHKIRDIPETVIDGIKLLSYSNINGISISRNLSYSNFYNQFSIARNLSIPRIYLSISDQNMVNDLNDNYILSNFNCHIDIDTINARVLKRLQVLLWLELVSIFDGYQIKLTERRLIKNYDTGKGQLFGVSINTLLLRDEEFIGKSSKIPLFLEELLAQLTERGIYEEGILRIQGNAKAIKELSHKLETNFYKKPNKYHGLLNSAKVHELSALLKQWLLKLPQSLFTIQYVDLLYQCDVLTPLDKVKAISIICKLLPPEIRNVLRSLLRFLDLIVQHEHLNKMNLDNVARMIALNILPLNAIYSINKENIRPQLNDITQRCHLANILIKQGERLFQIQLSSIN